MRISSESCDVLPREMARNESKPTIASFLSSCASCCPEKRRGSSDCALASGHHPTDAIPLKFCVRKYVRMLVAPPLSARVVCPFLERWSQEVQLVWPQKRRRLGRNDGPAERYVRRETIARRIRGLRRRHRRCPRHNQHPPSVVRFGGGREFPGRTMGP